MKRYTLIILFALLTLFASSVSAQDATSEPTAAATVAVETGTSTDTETEGDTGSTSTTGMNPDMVFVGIVLLSLIFGMADKFSNYSLSKKLADSVPKDWQPALEMGANTARRIVYERAGAFADTTPSPIDNNLLDEDMKRAGWEFYTDAATGERHARKRLEVTAGGVSPAG